MLMAERLPQIYVANFNRLIGNKIDGATNVPRGAENCTKLCL